MILKIITRFCG